MERKGTVLIAFFMGVVFCSIAQTLVPNGGFENWTSYGTYSNPVSWDTPNQSIQIAIPFGTQVVTKSSDANSGSFSARLETKQLTMPSVVVPGAVTLGTFNINIFTISYGVSGGVPISDKPTHLHGFYKYMPAGVDSCVIGIGLTKWNNGTRDSVGAGAFYTHETVNTWTPFYAWIDYVLTEQPDTFNILAISSADTNPKAGTVLFVDDISLDYTQGVINKDPSAGIDIYQDREMNEILVYMSFQNPENTRIQLFNMTGQLVWGNPAETIVSGRRIIDYREFSPGVYIMEILHGKQVLTRKFILKS